MPTIRLTQPFCKTAVHVADPTKPGADRTIYWHEDMPGFGLVVTRDGKRSFCCQYRNSEGVSRRATIPGGLVKLKDAIKAARAIQGQVARDLDPVAAKRAARKAARAATKGTLEKIATAYLKHGAVDKAGNVLRSLYEYQRTLKKYVYPKLGARPIDSIRRSEIAKLLDHIATAHGPVQADHTLRLIGRIMRWHAVNSDDFNPPLVAGMARTSIRDRARTRTLTDDEIRALWAACGASGTPYSYMLRFILLTATRLREASNASRTEFNGNGGADWTIPAARHKSKREFLLPLSKAAQDILARTPQVGTKGLLFTHDGDVPINSFSKGKREVDKAMLAELRKHDPEAELPQWQTHDLRRTARTLMTRAGVPDRHAEMALGHTIPGVEGVYNRHAYRDEKLAAFEALARQIGMILDPQPNVIPMPQRAGTA